ncbi:MAG: hypothetical protein KF852_04145 [Saprospiraceae bacterium]|nr:hypothetical protein [Saprospiraceae bacterium]
MKNDTLVWFALGALAAVIFFKPRTAPGGAPLGLPAPEPTRQPDRMAGFSTRRGAEHCNRYL